MLSLKCSILELAALTFTLVRPGQVMMSQKGIDREDGGLTEGAVPGEEIGVDLFEDHEGEVADVSSEVSGSLTQLAQVHRAAKAVQTSACC